MCVCICTTLSYPVAGDMVILALPHCCPLIQLDCATKMLRNEGLFSFYWGLRLLTLTLSSALTLTLRFYRGPTPRIRAQA